MATSVRLLCPLLWNWSQAKAFQKTFVEKMQRLLSSLDLVMMGFPMGIGMPPPELHQDVQGGQELFFQYNSFTNYTMFNNISSMKHASKTVPGLDDVGVSNGDWGFHRNSGSRVQIKKLLPPRWSAWKTEGVGLVRGCLKAEVHWHICFLY